LQARGVHDTVGERWIDAKHSPKFALTIARRPDNSADDALDQSRMA
jgi:hypothetical protein